MCSLLCECTCGASDSFYSNCEQTDCKQPNQTQAAAVFHFRKSRLKGLKVKTVLRCSPPPPNWIPVRRNNPQRNEHWGEKENMPWRSQSSILLGFFFSRHEATLECKEFSQSIKKVAQGITGSKYVMDFPGLGTAFELLTGRQRFATGT